MESKLQMYNGRPTLFVDGKPTPAHAYTTYFEENKRPFHNFGNSIVRWSINALFKTRACLRLNT